MEDSSFNKNISGARIPPHSTEAEQAVIGGLLLDPDAFDKVADVLNEKDFMKNATRIYSKRSTN